MSDPVTIYHNPRCTKSRGTLELIRAAGIEPVVVEYLKTPPDAAALDRILKLLGKEPQDVVRKGESIFKELKLGEQGLDRKGWIKVMVANPILIERPIVVCGNRARLGRPPESVKEIL